MSLWIVYSYYLLHIPVHGIVRLSLSVCLFPSKIAEPLDASYSQKCFVHIPFSVGDGCALFIA